MPPFQPFPGFLFLSFLCLCVTVYKLNWTSAVVHYSFVLNFVNIHLSTSYVEEYFYCVSNIAWPLNFPCLSPAVSFAGQPCHSPKPIHTPTSVTIHFQFTIAVPWLCDPCSTDVSVFQWEASEGPTVSAILAPAYWSRGLQHGVKDGGETDLTKWAVAYSYWQKKRSVWWQHVSQMWHLAA